MSCWLLAEAFIDDISSCLSLCIYSFFLFLFFYPFLHLLLLFSFLSFYFKETDCLYTCFLLGATVPAHSSACPFPTTSLPHSNCCWSPLFQRPDYSISLESVKSHNPLTGACLSRFVLAIKVVLSPFLFLPLLSVPEGILSLHDVTQDIKGVPASLHALKHGNIWKWVDNWFNFLLFIGMFQHLVDKALGLHLNSLLRPLNGFCCLQNKKGSHWHCH